MHDMYTHVTCILFINCHSGQVNPPQSCTLNDNETSFLSIPPPPPMLRCQSSVFCWCCLSLSIRCPVPVSPWYLLTRVSGVGGGQRVLLFTQQVQAGAAPGWGHTPWCDDGFVVLRYVGTVTIYTGTQLCSPAYLHALKVANGKYWLIGIAWIIFLP